MEIKKILWPSDLSTAAAAALPYVSDLSQKYQAQVLLLYVAEDMRRFDHIYGDAGKHLAGLQEMERSRAHEHLQRVCEQDLAGCPSFAQHIVQGDPAQEIINFAEQNGAGLIVMASRGRGMDQADYKFFGGVTAKVVRHSPVPVLTINPAA